MIKLSQLLWNKIMLSNQQLNWEEPKPRHGWKGEIDKFIGPDATKVEIGLQLIPAMIAMIAAPIYAINLSEDWTLLQLGLITILGFDIVGGILTNATSAAKRWYHRPGQGKWQHLLFVVIHTIHLALVAIILRRGDWQFFWVVSSYLLIASGVIVSCPLYLQRPIALGLYGIVLLGDRYLLLPTPGLEWFIPLFFLKLLVSHLLTEIPYQQNSVRIKESGVSYQE